MAQATRFREAFAHNWRRVFAAIVALAALFLIVRSEPLHAEVNDVFAVARDVIAHRPGWGMALFVVLSALSAMIAFFSSAVLVPIGVYTWGTATTLILLWLGWLLGGIGGYSVGRYLGRQVVVWFVHDEQLRRYEQRVSRSAPIPVILLFQIALPSEVPGYVLGILRYSFPRYIVALAIAELPFAVGAVYLGESFIEGDYLRLVVIGLAGIALSVTAVTMWHRRSELPKER